MITQPTFVAGASRLLFQGRFETIPVRPNYDISLDGKQFVMIQGNEPASAPTELHIALNWSEDLNRRAPAARK